MFVAESTCVDGVMVATGGVFPSEEGLAGGAGDSGLDLRLKLGVGREWPKFRMLAAIRPCVLFFPDLLSPMLDIV